MQSAGALGAKVLLLLPLITVVAHACINGTCWVYGPNSPSDQPEWLAALQRDRRETQKRIGWKGGVFDLPSLRWTQTSYIQPQMHPFDRFFYDHEEHNYTVDRFLADLEARYGGVDAVLLWPTYPNIGVDDRSQFEYFRSLPGGLSALAAVTAELRRRNVRVLLPYNPWDGGTRPEPLSDQDAIAQLLKQTGGDGVNGDTMDFLPRTFWEAAENLSYPIALEPEGGGSDAEMNWATMGWGYYWFSSPRAGHTFYQKTPVVDRFKFITHGKFLTNICDRWAKSKTETLQLAWFNGDGYESWENVWGTWNGITPRDGEAIRRVATMLRFFGGLGFLQSPEWEPHAPGVVHPSDVFASRWPVNKSVTLWTIVNRGPRNFAGPQLTVDLHAPAAVSAGQWRKTGCRAVPHSDVYELASTRLQGHAIAHELGLEYCEDCLMHCFSEQQGSCIAAQFIESTGSCAFFTSLNGTAPGGPELQAAVRADYFHHVAQTTKTFVDCYHGTEIEPIPVGDGRVQLSFDIEAHGFGCVLELAEPAQHVAAELLPVMREMTKTPLANYSGEWNFLPQTMVSIPKTRRASSAPSGMVHVPQANFQFQVRGVEIEGDDAHGVDVQYPWEEYPRREHMRTMEVGPFYIDKFPVTAADYAKYLSETGYRPEDGYRWLENWNLVANDTGKGLEPPKDVANLPVTYVSLREAREYCAWAHGGSRLPHSFEWQYAAQGTDRRPYPWGFDRHQSAFPALQRGRTFRGPEPVTAHSPAGDSPFGVADLVGNVWQYTDEFRDVHTRAVILRGGSNYRPAGSSWYFPQALELDTHGKYFLMDDRYERAGTIGFRCVVDAEARPALLT